MAGPLDGIRILDMTIVVAGPLAAMMLADQGADVIKIETPKGGDFLRRAANRRDDLSASFLNNNRNKRSLAIDLKSDAGREAFLRLAETCDVVIQNFRPGVLERIGVGYDAVRVRKPDIIYLSMSGFGESGPFAHKPVYDPIIQALSGLTTVQAGSDQERPRLIRTVLPDKVTAITAAQTVTAALLARERGGEGQHIRLSMLDSTLAFLWSTDMNNHTFLDGEKPTQRAASIIDLIYETADGHMSVAVMTDAQWAGMSRGTGHPEWLEDPRFVDNASREHNIDARLELTQEALLEKTTAEWLEILEVEGVPCAPVLTRGEIADHPQIIESGSLVEFDHPTVGRLRQARPPAQFTATPSELRRGAPGLGEHTAEILGEAGFSAEEITALRQAGAVAG